MAANEFTSFSAGVSQLTAGGHPDANVSFSLATELGAIPGPGEFGIEVVKGGAPKDVVVELPKGLLGNPTAADRCTVPDLMIADCSVDSQVGYTDLRLVNFGSVTDAAAPDYPRVTARGGVTTFSLTAERQPEPPASP